MTVSVNGELISDNDIEQEMISLEPYYDRMQAELENQGSKIQLHDWAVENLIEQALFRQLAVKHFPVIDNREIDEVYSEMCQQCDTEEQFLEIAGLTSEQLRTNIVDSLRLEKLNEIIDSAVTPPSQEQMLEYYNCNRELFVQPAMADVDQVVIATDDNTKANFARDEIMRLEKKLKSGTSFDDLIKNNSDADEEDSYLGWITRGEMVDEFEKVVFGLKSGQVSRPFQTEIGWHIVRVNKMCPENTMTFDEAQEQISEHLLIELQDKARGDYIDAEKAKAQITR